MNEEEDDDTHFCLRCNATIEGLDAYVAHRKAKCRVTSSKHYNIELQQSEPLASNNLSTLTESEIAANPQTLTQSDESHKDVPHVDDYFLSSLCLQSSSKTGESVTNLKCSGIATRSKALVKGSIKEDKSSLAVSHEEGDQQEETDSEESDDGRHPPPTSGGKWLPGFKPPRRTLSVLWKSNSTPENKSEEAQSVVSTTLPPSTYTKGKWDSSERPWGQLRGSNAYWCGPCNRRLSSKVVYDRHIKSELHFKRTNYWRGQPGPASQKRPDRRKSIREVGRPLNRNVNQDTAIGKIKGRRKAIICVVCNYRVAPHLIGKHLTSHYHWNRSKSDEEANATMVLKYMHSIVRQAPLQCSLCKFYCNTRTNFHDHWTSEMHLQNDLKRSGIYWCSHCNFEAESSVEMECHIVDQLHQDQVAIINQSFPVVIQKITPLQCDKCNKCFRYNFQLKKHGITWGHEQKQGTASIGYQETSTCSECAFTCFSLVTFEKHRLLKHKKRRYCCRTCNLNFGTQLELKKHRGTGIHKTAVKNKNCRKPFKTLKNLKSRLKEVHTEIDSRDVIGQPGVVPNPIRCPLCQKDMPSQAALNQHVKTKHRTRTRVHKCSECDLSFYERGTLERHKQTHFGKKFRCPEAGCIFNGRSMGELKIHSRTHSTSRDFRCQQCSYSSKTKNQLVKHQKQVHSSNSQFKCPQCEFSCKTVTHLKRHLRIHSGLKPYKCPHCPFNCTSLDNLRKHIISSKIHPGKKVYECSVAGCDFAVNMFKELKTHLMKGHNMSAKEIIALTERIFKTSDDSPRPSRDHPEQDDNSRDSRNDFQADDAVYTDVEIETEDERLPTLASVALTPSKTDEEIVFMHVVPSCTEDQTGYDPTIFHQSFPNIEAFPGQTRYDHSEMGPNHDDH